eukprot:comp21556_c1_seq1/m.30074 comp21556_c1_seq1/g.30074  ORF comp21556_c1_seq1/g.30074 comp21556_c1_seq1/m.30074 type:complete len:196 (-) comp21556_c1_seq1:503-1090(-)
MAEAWSLSPPNTVDVSFERFILRVSSRKLRVQQHRSRLLNSVLIQNIHDKALDVVTRANTTNALCRGIQRDGLRKSRRKIPRASLRKPNTEMSMWDVVEEEDRLKRQREEDRMCGNRKKTRCDSDSYENPNHETMGIITPSPSPPKETADDADFAMEEDQVVESCGDASRAEEEDFLASSSIMGIAYLLKQTTAM